MNTENVVFLVVGISLVIGMKLGEVFIRVFRNGLNDGKVKNSEVKPSGDSAYEFHMRLKHPELRMQYPPKSIIHGGDLLEVVDDEKPKRGAYGD